MTTGGSVAEVISSNAKARAVLMNLRHTAVITSGFPSRLGRTMPQVRAFFFRDTRPGLIVLRMVGCLLHSTNDVFEALIKSGRNIK